MSSKNIHVLVQNTLDGAGAVLAIGWAYPEASVSYTVFTGVATSFRSKFGNKNLSLYDIVFSIDLALEEKDLPLIDKSNVILLTKTEYKLTTCKSIHVRDTCTQSLYKLLSNKLDITSSQKQLLVYIGDYVQNTLLFKKSIKYNSLFKNLNLIQFIKEFVDGDRDFRVNELSLIDHHNKEILNYYKSIQLFKATIDMHDKSVLFIGAFANKYIGEIANIITSLFPDSGIVFVYNPETDSVLFKKGNESTLNVETVAKHLCDSSSGAYVCKGAATDKFLNFTKKFFPIDVN